MNTLAVAAYANASLGCGSQKEIFLPFFRYDITNLAQGHQGAKKPTLVFWLSAKVVDGTASCKDTQPVFIAEALLSATVKGSNVWVDD
jgi:hypothetical protein